MPSHTQTVEADYAGTIAAPPYATSGSPWGWSIVGGGGANMFHDGTDSTYAQQSLTSAPTADFTGPLVTFPAIDLTGIKRSSLEVTFSVRRKYNGLGTGATMVFQGYPDIDLDGVAWLRTERADAAWGSGSWETVTLAVVGGDDATNPDELGGLIASITAGLPIVVTIDSSTGAGISGSVSEISMTVTWQTILVTPPLRQYPREDGLGTSSAPRLYPRPRSVQAGFRKVGPTYL